MARESETRSTGGSNPLFTVVIPLYNKADTITRTLASVRCQVFKDFEVVIVDDGSKDDGATVARKAGIDLPMTVIEQENAGVSVARNVGVEQAKGKYVAFLDADDEWHSDFLLEIVTLIQEYPTCEVYGTNYANVSSSGVMVRRRLLHEHFTCDFFHAWVWCCPLHTSSCAILKTAFIEVGGFIPGHKYYEDAELLFKFADRGRFAISMRVLLKYHTDAAIRATAAKMSYAQYAHWNYLESALHSGGGSRGIKYVAKWEMVRRFVEDRLHRTSRSTLLLTQTFPNMVTTSGISGRIIREGAILAWPLALAYKVVFVLNSRTHFGKLNRGKLW